MIINNKFITWVKKLILKKDMQELKKILNNFNVNTANTNFYTPLHLAIIYGNEEIFELIIKLNPELETQTNVGRTPLHLSIQQQNMNMLKKLLTYKINAEIQTINGLTPLHLSVYLQNEEAVEALLNYGVNPNLKTKEGYTPLHWALIKKNIYITIKLLKHGAKAEIKNSTGKNAFNYMNSTLQKEITETLLNEYKSIYQAYYENKLKIDMLFKVPKIMCLKCDLENYFLTFLTPYTKKEIERLKKIIKKSLKEINVDWLFLNKIEEEIIELTKQINENSILEATSEEQLATTSESYTDSFKEKQINKINQQINENSILEATSEEQLSEIL